jgi:hypothetical protein
MGMTSGAKGRSGPPTPAVVGTGRSMRARDVSRPRQPVNRRPVESKQPVDEQPVDDQSVDERPEDQGSGGSSPVDS